MGAFEVYNNPLKRRYYASGVCSLASCLCILTYIIALLLPLFLGILTDNFWTRNSLVYEQPVLTYQQKLIVFLHGFRFDNETGAKQPMELAWTTSQDLNDRLGDNVARVPQVRTSWGDTNLDNVPDVNYLSVAMPLQFEEQIHSISVFAFYNFMLKDEKRFEMDGMLSASVSSGVPGRQATVSGDLKFTQRSRISMGGGVLRPFGGREFTPLNRDTKIRDIRPESIVSRYTRRNFTISVEQPAISGWQAETAYDPVTGADTAGLAGANRYFKLNMDVRSSKVQIWTRPSIIFIFKQAWIQYLSIFVLVYAILMWLNRIIYSEYIIHARRVDDASNSQKHKHM
eukprot:gb/GECG01010560.1/.p1 GENE.gb/GECG01010560.1/~~gb/GECG01010560.1/.p1  ORF type:complete len:342 (+),score=16.39 gb/GECG01010560.1/:1-1026(+)